VRARATVSAIRHSLVAEDAVGAQEVGGPVGDEPVSTESIPRSVRVGIGVFLALFLFTGVFEIQAWPFTGWRLFSHTRSDESVALVAVAVDRAGHSYPLHGRRVSAFRDLSAVAANFDGLSPPPRPPRAKPGCPPSDTSSHPRSPFASIG